MCFKGPGAIKKLQKGKKAKALSNPIYHFLPVHTLKSFSLSHTPSVNIACSPQSCTRSESTDFHWINASHVTRLPIHTSQTSPHVSEHLCGEGSVSQIRRLQSYATQ